MTSMTAMPDMTLIEVSQWRGSGSPTAERLHDGARLLAEMVPAARRLRVDVDDSLPTTASKVRSALSEADGLVVTIGGDCGVELEPITEAMRRHGDRLMVVWFDAHGDLNTPSSSPSGAFHGMVLRALTGEGPEGLVPDQPVRPHQIVLAGVRALDPAEAAFIEASGIRHIRAADPAALTAAIAGPLLGSRQSPGQDHADSGRKAVYVHIDLDVLDPRIFTSVGCPEPDGFHPDELLAMVTAVAERYEVAGLGITEYEPSRPEDQDLLAPLVKALAEVCARS
ncbi:arginase [Nonomuraea cavernae]|uniref:Arginase n=2 Tax=Nonomuraea cavernae TaxID=2045107 RepID=A0A917YUW0_9ACTN|nr:arginase [Nonomuraea cavernae]